MIEVYFGSPGAGKTTIATKLAIKDKKHSSAFLNFSNSVPGVGEYNAEGIGRWRFPDGALICLDEAGIEYNSRSYKTMSKESIRWFKLHRHWYCDVSVLSQSWDDMDVTIRRLATRLWYIKRIGPWTLARRVYKWVGVDKETHQIIDGYDMASLWWLIFWPLQLGFPFDKKFTLTFRPFYYKYFDSYEAPDIPIGDFKYNPKKEEGIWLTLTDSMRKLSKKTMDSIRHLPDIIKRK